MESKMLKVGDEFRSDMTPAEWFEFAKSLNVMTDEDLAADLRTMCAKAVECGEYRTLFESRKLRDDEMQALRDRVAFFDSMA